VIPASGSELCDRRVPSRVGNPCHDCPRWRSSTSNTLEGTES
jgi:hypothetical protein